MSGADVSVSVPVRLVRAGHHRIAFTDHGPRNGPVVVLLHGLASDRGTWDRATGPLAARGLRVLAVDLIGHGDSDKPRLRYLLDDFADSLRDFLDAVDVEQAVLVGHSLGGAISVHFAARYPGRVSRLVLVSAGGLGREVHPVLRACALPIAPAVLWLITRRPLRRVYRHPRVHRWLRLAPERVENLRRFGRALGTAAGQAAFFASLRGVIEPGGQRGNFLEMGTLELAPVPTLLVWNRGDPIIPLAHARAAHEHLPDSELVVFPHTTHDPHRGSPQEFADAVAAFIARPTMRDHNP
ncbi:alpha/beta fold hydrolase [Jatrophihabitans fulvus]